MVLKSIFYPDGCFTRLSYYGRTIFWIIFLSEFVLWTYLYATNASKIYQYLTIGCEILVCMVMFFIVMLYESGKCPLKNPNENEDNLPLNI